MLARPDNLNFFCHEMAEPEPVEDMRWHLVLEPFYLEFGIPPPEPSTNGARRSIDPITVDLLEPFSPSIVSFKLPASSRLNQIKAKDATELPTAMKLTMVLSPIANGRTLSLTKRVKSRA